MSNAISPPDSCLIGHTGFVGGHLAQQAHFASRFTRVNISDSAGRRFDTVVCAAAPGSMFEANRFPERDQENIQALVNALSRITAKRFVLISSIAVLAHAARGDDETTTAFEQTHAYGRNRRALEEYCEKKFMHCLIVRLPALFGHGLRKNFLFDLLNPVPTMLPESSFARLCGELDGPLADLARHVFSLDQRTQMRVIDRHAFNVDPRRPALEAAVTTLGCSAVRFHNPRTTYQYYDMTRLWPDIEVALAAGLRHVHLSVAPLQAASIYRRLLGSEMPDSPARVYCEDMRTRHSALWGKTGPYLVAADATLKAIATFFDNERKAGCGLPCRT